MASTESSSFATVALARAREAGLERAVSEFPEDVVAAAGAAADAQRACAEIGGVPTDEPWPPMRARTAS